MFAVNAAVATGAQSGLWQVAVVWAVGVSLGIYTAASLSGAHINPAITLTAAVYDRFPILEERKDQKAGTMSGGQQQMLAMGRALMLDPDLLLLDEPSAGLAPDLVQEMFDKIDEINEAGTAVLMVEQNAKEALRRCDRGYVLANGQNRYMDRGSALLEDEQVRQDFLGG